MRLGAYPCRLRRGQLCQSTLRHSDISERHRHRYEFNREFEGLLTSHGLRLTGQTPDGMYVEICEVAGSPLVSGLPVPPGIQIEAAGTASAFCLVSRGRLKAPG